MADRTVDGQIGTNPLLDAGILIGRMGQGPKTVHHRWHASGRKVTGIMERTDLIVGDAIVVEVAIHLRRVKSDRQAADGCRRVATQTFRPSGVMPDLRA